MPKLTQYVQHKSQNEQTLDKNASKPPRQVQQPSDVAQSPPHSRPVAQPPQQLDATREPPLEPELDAAVAKLQLAYDKRTREHGPRLFRWPDGSLRPDKPPPNPYSVANRMKWSQIVQHCRTHGGDRNYDNTGHSLRYNINVPYTQHANYLETIGLQPETDAQGIYQGFDTELTRPLRDPAHALNSFYKAEADKIFSQPGGRLL